MIRVSKELMEKSKEKLSTQKDLPNPNDNFAERMVEVVDMFKTIAGFARMCGMSDTAIHQYMQGKSLPTADKLVRIADAAGVNVEWLAAGRGPKVRQDDERRGMDQVRMTTALQIYGTACVECGGEPSPDDAANLIGLTYQLLGDREDGGYADKVPEVLEMMKPTICMAVEKEKRSDPDQKYHFLTKEPLPHKENTRNVYYYTAAV